MIVFAAERLGDVQYLKRLGLPAHVRFHARQKLLRHVLERLADTPHAGLAVGVEIREHTQNALAIVGARWKRVHVHAFVVGPPRLGTRFHLHGAKAGGSQPHDVRVFGKQVADQALGVCAKAFDQGGELLQRSRIARSALQRAIHIQADIAGLGSADIRSQQRPLRRVEFKGKLRKIQHLASFDSRGPLRVSGNCTPVGAIYL